MAGCTKILIDNGRSGKYIAACLNDMGISPEELDCLLVTHEHIDHTAGVGILSRRYNLPIYTTKGTWDGMTENGVLGKIDDNLKNVIEPGNTFTLGALDITAFSIPHDANEPVGYSFHSKRAHAAIATDMGYLCDCAKDELFGADIVLLESNYDTDSLKNGSYPYHLKQRILGETGHLSNYEAAHLAVNLARSGTKYIVLGHLSKENNTPQLAYNEVAVRMKDKGITVGRDVQLIIADRHNAIPVISV